MREVDPKVDEAIANAQHEGRADAPEAAHGHRPGERDRGRLGAARRLLIDQQQRQHQRSAAGCGGRELPSTPPWKFAFVNHVTTNPFFVPTQYGLAGRRGAAGDPEAVLDRLAERPTFPRWSAPPTPPSRRRRTGSRSRWSARPRSPTPHGERHERRHPGGLLQRRRQRRRPGHQPAGLHRPGPVPVRAGAGAADRWPGCPTAVTRVGFIATPGTANIQPRIDGAKQAIKASGKNINFTSVASGAAAVAGEHHHQRLRAGAQVHPEGNLRGGRRSTQTVGADHQEVQPGRARWPSGGFDLTPADAAVDQGRQPAVHHRPAALPAGLPAGAGPLPVQPVRRPGGPPETNTGLTFVTKDNVGPYLNTTSRYEGSSTQQKLHHALRPDRLTGAAGFRGQLACSSRFDIGAGGGTLDPWSAGPVPAVSVLRVQPPLAGT